MPLCSIFLIYRAKSISSKHFCLESCWLDRSVFGPREGLALGALPGGTQLLEDRQDEARPQQKQIFLTTIISPGNSLPSTTRNRELLLYFDSFQHTWRIRHTVPSTNEKKIQPLEQNQKSFPITLPSSSARCKMPNQTQPSSQCLGGGELNTLCSDNQNTAISNRPFFSF